MSSASKLKFRKLSVSVDVENFNNCDLNISSQNAVNKQQKQTNPLAETVAWHWADGNQKVITVGKIF